MKFNIDELILVDDLSGKTFYVVDLSLWMTCLCTDDLSR